MSSGVATSPAYTTLTSDDQEEHVAAHAAQASSSGRTNGNPARWERHQAALSNEAGMRQVEQELASGFTHVLSAIPTDQWTVWNDNTLWMNGQMDGIDPSLWLDGQTDWATLPLNLPENVPTNYGVMAMGSLVCLLQGTYTKRSSGLQWRFRSWEIIEGTCATMSIISPSIRVRSVISFSLWHLSIRRISLSTWLRVKRTSGISAIFSSASR
ncbi:hypothetical protein QBC46DRAFT_67815 [Diplogelasinospora grovesii]|uniref:Uncharacterized protein n=1 Tax=Diplogelasinospora grovesii TaxID=303347 RepID=A0AAN6MXR8_9PEZI|nr:hypothetical protein QBC46DRAFT_67815 [Diplogelasinospora grovesii]